MLEHGSCPGGHRASSYLERSCLTILVHDLVYLGVLHHRDAADDLVASHLVTRDESGKNRVSAGRVGGHEEPVSNQFAEQRKRGDQGRFRVEPALPTEGDDPVGD